MKSDGAYADQALFMQIETFVLEKNGWVPNNPHLPVVFYKDVFPAEQLAVTFADVEEMFRQHGWEPRWRDGVYRYHHYHTTAHEVLGFASGSARLQLGGPNGREIAVKKGQALLLPCGVAHRCLEADDDFLAVGAYPPGQDWDLCKTTPTPEQLDRIEHFPIPDSDPVEGKNGVMCDVWRC
jgi:uncharacterized protein YjlB